MDSQPLSNRPSSGWRRTHNMRSSTKTLRMVVSAAAVICLGLILLFISLYYWILRPDFTLQASILKVDLVEQNASLGLTSLGVAEDVAAFKSSLEDVPAEFKADEEPPISQSDPSAIREFIEELSAVEQRALIVYAPIHLVCSATDTQIEGSNSRLDIITGDYELDPTNSLVPLIDLINAIAESPAQTKLLILNGSRVPPGPREGLYSSDYIDALEDILKGERESRGGDLWVMTSHGRVERSHLMIHEAQSVFGYYLTQALKGAASDNYGRITIGNLYEYVFLRVSNYAWLFSDRKHTQFPKLFRVSDGVCTEIFVQKGSEHLAEAKNEIVLITSGNYEDQKKDPNQIDEDKANGELAAQENRSDPQDNAKSNSKATIVDPKNSTDDAQDDGDESAEEEGSLKEKPKPRPTWTELDYAPSAFRTSREIFVGEQIRSLWNPKYRSSFKRPEKELSDWKTSFTQGTLVDHIQHDHSLTEAYQTRNRLLFGLPYYIQLGIRSEKEEEVQKNNDIVKAIENAIENAGVLQDHLAQELPFRIDEPDALSTSAVSHKRRFKDESRKAAESLAVLQEYVFDSIVPQGEGDFEDPILVLDCLRTPLIDSKSRQVSWDILRKHSKAVNKKIAGMRESDLRSMLNEIEPEKVAKEHYGNLKKRVDLYNKLLDRLGFTRSLENNTQGNGRVESQKTKASDRRKSHNLRSRYAGLPSQIHNESIDGLDLDLALRIIAGLDPANSDSKLRSARTAWANSELNFSKERIDINISGLEDPLKSNEETRSVFLTIESEGLELPQTLGINLDYESDLIEVNHDLANDNSTLRLTENHLEIPLTIRPKKLNGKKTFLNVEIQSKSTDGLQTSRRISFQLPQPRYLEVEVIGRKGTLRSARSDVSDAFVKLNANFSVNSSIPLARFELNPYPTNNTEFEVRLYNPSHTRELTPKLSLWAIPRSLVDEYENTPQREQPERFLRDIAENEFSKAKRFVSGLQVVIGPRENIPLPMAEPSGDSEENKKAPDAATNKMQTKDVHGLLVLLEDAAADLRQMIYFKIDVLHPDQYVATPKVNFDAKNRILSIDLGRDPDYSPKRPISARWDIDRYLSRSASPTQARSLRSEFFPEYGLERTISASTNGNLPQALFAKVNKNCPRPLFVSLTVDNYPRAFRFIHPLVGESGRRLLYDGEVRVHLIADENGKPKRDEEGQLIFLEDGVAFKKLKFVHMLLEVDFPREKNLDYRAMLELTNESRKVVETLPPLMHDRAFDIELETGNQAAKSEENRNSTSLDPTFRLWVNPRPIIRSFGALDQTNQKLSCKVLLQHFDPNEAIWKLVQGSYTQSEIAIIDDRVPPEILGLSYEPLYIGHAATLIVRVKDNLTDVNTVEYSFSNSENSKYIDAIESANGRFEIILKKDDIHSETIPIYLRATDMAGNLTLPKDREFILHAKEYVEPPKPPVENTLEVFVLSEGKKPIEGVTVALSGQRSMEEESDEQGRCLFDKLPPGKYTVKVKGNVSYKGQTQIWLEQELTVEAAPAKGASISLIALSKSQREALKKESESE